MGFSGSAPFMSAGSEPQGGLKRPPPGKAGQGLPMPEGARPTRDPYGPGGHPRDPTKSKRFGPGTPGGGQMTQSPHGWDFSSPGTGEQFWNQQQQGFTQQGAGEGFFDRTKGQYQRAGQGEQHWNRIQGQFNEPTASQQTMQDPGLGQYYSRAKERTGSSLNNQLAARGGFGSSAGLDQVSQAMTDLDAQQANREADYRLRQAGQADQAFNQRQGLAGQLANQAQSQQLARLGQGQQAGFGADAQRLAGLTAGMQGAGMAQGLRRQRGRDYIGDLMGSSGQLMQQNQMGMNQLLTGDRENMMDAIYMALGLPREALNQDINNQKQHREDIDMVMDIIGSFMGGGGGGGGGMMGGMMGGGG